MKKLILVLVFFSLLLSCSTRKSARPVSEGIATGILSAGDTSMSSMTKTSSQVEIASGVVFEFIPWLLKDRSERPTRGTQSYEIMEEGESIRD